MPTLLENKKVRFDYEILETFEGGLELRGFEVKSLREKRGSIKEAYVIIRGGEIYLVGAHIPAYQPKNAPEGYDTYRNRKILLTKKEIKKLIGKEKMKGLTIVPISMYTKGRRIKIKIAVAKGKKKYDKREKIKKRDTERDLRRTLKE